jgi:membrane AbrB-like protein
MLARVAAALAVLALGAAMGAIGLPSSYLFAALVVGVGFALVRPGAVSVPGWGFTAGQAVTGVVLGAYLRSSTLSAVASDWLPVTLVSLGTLAVTTLCGIVLARVAPVDRPTASLGMIAGGASGIVGMADELGADARLVAFMQYLRVLLIVAFTPIAAGVLFGAHGGNVPSESLLGTPVAWALTIGLAVVGALAGPRLRIPAGALLAPLLLTGVLTVAGLDLAVPALLREVGFSLIGLQVGLRFTVETLRTARAILPAVLTCIAGLVVACGALAWVLSVTADVSMLNAYLATTPGGLYAVLATAFGSGANTTFVLAVQGLRLLVMVLAAPLVVRRLVRGRPGARELPSAVCSPRSTSSVSRSRPSESSSR